MLEVLVRRHYLEYELHDLRNASVNGRAVTTADYTLDGRPTHLVSTIGTVDELADTGSALVRDLTAEIEARPVGHEAVVDLYLSWPGTPEVQQEASDRLCEVIAALPFIQQVRRVAVAVVPGNGREVWYFTYRPSSVGIVEDDNVRGVHPMVGRRLNLWRLRDFRITRLEAPEDVLLYHCVARDNEADERLVALAQVRQFAVVRDEAGKVTSLPHVERAIANCLEGIRRARTARGAAGARLEMNHVWVTVWPVIDGQVAELTALQRNIAPLTAGAGIEEVVVTGRVIGSATVCRSRWSAGSTTSPAPVSWWLSSGLRPSRSSLSTTTRRRSCGPVAATPSIPMKWLAWSSALAAASSSTT